MPARNRSSVKGMVKKIGKGTIANSKNGGDDLEKQGLELLKKGIKGKKWKFNREELHER